MKIYLVRHGLYEKTDPHTFPLDEVPLSAKGKSQIKENLISLNNKGLEVVITSPLVRTSQTAEIVSTDLDLALIKSELLRERKRPSELVGIPIESKTAKKITRLLRDNYHDPTYNYSDEENFRDLKARARQAIEFLLNQNRKNVCVVTHAEILAMLIAVMILGNELTSQLYVKIRDFLFVGMNTPIVIEYKDDKWRLMQWNVGLDRFLNL